MDRNEPVRILFVCLGNICRSPLAEGVFQSLVDDAGLSEAIEIDSAGTGNWHVGEKADRRMRETSARHGVVLTSRARQIDRSDFSSFDRILAMDKSNLHDILFLDRDGSYADRVRLFREYDPEPGDYQVPDPYYGGPDGFETVYRIVDRTARALLDDIRSAYGLTAT